jgi:hypothetical protein
MASWDVMELIAGRNRSPFSQKKNWLAIPNVSWGFLSYEADLLVISRSKYCTEIEVKVPMADWKQDFSKRKHRFPDNRIKYQYYAAPFELAKRYTELPIPEDWGIIGVSEKNKVEILKPAVAKKARQITDKELMILARLACFRVWRKE